MNIEMENKLVHLEAENDGLRKLISGKNDLLKKIVEENEQLTARIKALEEEQE